MTLLVMLEEFTIRKLAPAKEQSFKGEVPQCWRSSSAGFNCIKGCFRADDSALLSKRTTLKGSHLLAGDPTKG